MAQFQWFPGHMAKTLRELKELLKLCDLIIEVCDSRIVSSGRNPLIDELSSGKPRIIVLNKEDLADPQVSSLWLEQFKAAGEEAILLDARNARQVKNLQNLSKKLCQAPIARAKARGRRNYTARVLVLGIPNCGKSTLINSLVGKRKAETANKPGVTRNLKWWKLGAELQLLDSPGLLWPKIDKRDQAIKLGACAAIKDEVMPRVELAGELVLLLFKLYPMLKAEKFSLLALDENDLAGMSKAEQANFYLEHIAKNYGFIQHDGKSDLNRTAVFILKQFRSAKLGRLSLDWPS